MLVYSLISQQLTKTPKGKEKTRPENHEQCLSLESPWLNGTRELQHNEA